jgi:hypothetical protein
VNDQAAMPVLQRDVIDNGKYVSDTVSCGLSGDNLPLSKAEVVGRFVGAEGPI